MDTKSKNTNLTRGLFSWFCYLLVFCTLIIVSVYSIALFTGYGSDIFPKAEHIVKECSQVLRGELRTLDTYKENASACFERLYYNTKTSECINGIAQIKFDMGLLCPGCAKSGVAKII